jgi:deferrochelatase/peroxidase EfeB
LHADLLHALDSFGYLDGVSNPAIKGYAPDANPPPGPAPVDPGVIVTGYLGDEKQKDRESWQLDGSFLVFRYLFQKVPEFDNFVFQNRLKGPGLTDKEGADLLGARLIGRWKSGMPSIFPHNLCLGNIDCDCFQVHLLISPRSSMTLNSV